jgi:alpha-tubulin suppressor-like RCC1 family protein
MHARLNAGRLLVMASVCFASACASTDHPTQPASMTPTTTKTSPGPFHVAAATVTAPAAPLVYVALPPDSIPTGISATINDPRTGSSVTVTMVNGGFDPVAVSALVGDTLRVTVQTSGAPLSFDIPVPEYDPPIVVRTDPVPVKRDVPLNATIVVVFSQPIRVATLTSSSMQLRLGGMPVAGQLSFTDDSNLIAQFVPTAPLVAGASYELVVTQAVEDWNGNPLKAGVTVTFTTVPPVLTGLVFTSVSAGWDTACGLTQAGAAYCWGQNNTGNFQTGLRATAPRPYPVPGGLVFTTLSVGTYHTCGLVSSGAAYCWGSNLVGELGDGTTNDSATPVAVAGGLTFSMISAGLQHTCGLTQVGKAYCWGYNAAGELGDADVANANRSTPTPVAGGFVFTVVSAGTSHTCGLLVTGAAMCWGFNILGWQGEFPGNVTMPVAIGGGLAFTALSAGENLTCGLVASGAAYCWGDNYSGQLGTDAPATSVTPVAVGGGLTFASVRAGGSEDFTIFSIDGPHACGVTVGGAAYCWGDNSYGALGNGTTTSSSAPVAVAGGLSFSSVTAGGAYNCGRTRDGVVYCWGANTVSQLGDGTTTTSSVPVKVAGQP